MSRQHSFLLLLALPAAFFGNAQITPKAATQTSPQTSPQITTQSAASPAASQPIPIRTITAGVTLKDLNDTATLLDAITFLQSAKATYEANGYNVQTLRIATNNFPQYAGDNPYGPSSIAALKKFDEIVGRNKMIISIGQLMQGDSYPAGIDNWALTLIQSTKNISCSVPISSHSLGIHKSSIQAAAAIIISISKGTEGGEGNFRFTASANCPAGIPFFPAAWHQGSKSFAIGLESPNIITEVFARSNTDFGINNNKNIRQDLTTAFAKTLLPIQQIAEKISTNSGTVNSGPANSGTPNSTWTYDGIDDSPAPGLNSSIGQAIETYTGRPFGSPSTLSTCALITDVLKNLPVKICGYSGLMLPVIEDKVLAQRAGEERYTVQELLLFSSVSGTGLDVVPLPGNTPATAIENLLTDIAALSLKYTAKALSGRLFLIPGKTAGQAITFKNPNLTPSVVMKVE
jgi:uncharacterized protein (UPF0210 family)